MREKIDWIAYSQKQNVEWSFPGFISDLWKNVRPLPNYTNGQENKQGIRRYWNTINSKQGRMCVLDGSSLDLLGENREEFLFFTGNLDNKITRVDYCLDIIDGSFNPKTVVSHLRNRDVITHAKEIPRQVDDWKKGFTQYVGKKSSETYTRIYDKAIEQKQEGRWTRIETVYQGDRAEASFQAYLLCGSTRNLILSHVDFPKWKAWRRVMQGNKVKLNIAPHETATREWLLGSVSKTIAKELLLDDDQAFLFELIERVKFEYKTLTKDEHDLEW